MDRTEITAARYQAQARAMRTIGERAKGVLMEARKRCPDVQTQIQIKAAIDLLTEAHGLDFTNEDCYNDYRVPGGTK